MSNRAGLSTLARAVAMMFVGAVATAPLPAWANDDLPPPEYNIGGATEADTLRILSRAEDVWVDVIKVDVDQVFAVCDAKNRDHLGKPYPSKDSERLIGCFIPAGRYTYSTLVYPYDPKRPELAHRLLLHEIGHLMGWPANHKAGPVLFAIFGKD